MKILNRKKIIRFFSAVLACLAFFMAAFYHPLSAQALDDPDIQSASVILAEMDTAQVLYSKDENQRRAPASLTKIMTLLLAVEAYESGSVSLSDTVVITSDAGFDIPDDGSTSGLAPGEEISFEDLLYISMLTSANDTCNVLAEFISGNVADFIALMNQRATELGCTDTHFANTHGMPNNDHYSTAHDIMLMVRCAMDKSLFRELASTTTYTVSATNLSEARSIRTTNHLLRSESVYYYPYASGVKTGYTDSAGYCLASTATKDGLTLIAVVMGAKSVVLADGTTQTQSFSETKSLYEWGFNGFSYQSIITTMNLIKEVPVELGKGSATVVLRPAKGITALLPNDTDISATRLQVRVYSEEQGEALYAPISQGTVLGEMSVTLNGVDYGTVSLVANTAVELDRVAYIKHQIGETLSNTYVKLAIIALIIFLCGYVAYVIMYTVNRRRRMAAADALARKRIAQIREEMEEEEPTTGKTFEEIEELHRRKK